jgi:hypothetical protein
MKIKIKLLVFVALLVTASACKKYLDVVPDNVATIDNAFTMGSQAKKFLFTCYSYLPKHGDLGSDPAMTGGDEIWRLNDFGGEMFNIARGFQNVVAPYGSGYWTNMYRGIRDCNIFLENIGKVPDMSETEKRRWIAEVKFLKAYYHFYLVRMYGPVPILKENLPVGADADVLHEARQPVDSCFNYITKLLDESTEALPVSITDPASEAGRITVPIALSVKALVLVTAASPLFNGNTDQEQLVNVDGTKLFNTAYSDEKWARANEACEAAIDACHASGLKLYKYSTNIGQFELTDTIKTQLNIRNSVTERWNSEVIWANTQSYPNYLQQVATPPLAAQFTDNNLARGELSPPLKIAEMFYSENGVPINEDKDWGYANRYKLKTATSKDRLYVKNGYTTARLNFDREPRFYADLGFDGGIWYGHERYDDKAELFHLEARNGQRNSGGNNFRSTVTGYFLKKLIHYQNVIGSGLTQTYSLNAYPWPVIRLSDLYLMHAEALNELSGPSDKVYNYLNLIRERAGLASVESSWRDHSTNPSKYTSKIGLREIIHQERLIELAFESHRFWDLRRWKKAADVMNGPINGWDLSQKNELAYYQPRITSGPLKTVK